MDRKYLPAHFRQRNLHLQNEKHHSADMYVGGLRTVVNNIGICEKLTFRHK